MSNKEIKDFIQRFTQERCEERAIICEFGVITNKLQQRDQEPKLKPEEWEELENYLVSSTQSYRRFRSWGGGSLCRLLAELEPLQIFNVISKIGLREASIAINTVKSNICDSSHNDFDRNIKLSLYNKLDHSLHAKLKEEDSLRHKNEYKADFNGFVM